ncbi:MAG: hypothetical protein LAN36_11575 [Acidobacteriia bacterium]|nr:hypothetical protein [Terriglobia bacterium]
MPDPSLFDIAGAPQPESKWTSLATIRFISGLATQRSPYAPLDTRYNSRFIPKSDSLIDGQNVEISNKLTLQRRPGLAAYGVTSIPAPLAFFEWKQTVPLNISLVVDTASAVYRYSPTYAGIYFNKATGAGQTNFFNLIDTLYCGNGVDLLKITGPNLLKQSNTWGIGAGTNLSMEPPWTSASVFALTGGQTDPDGGSEATQLIWGTTGAGVYMEQDVVPNYTPIASNAFTFSLWMKQTGGAISVDLQIADQNGSVVNTTFALTSSWARYQVTGTMNSNSNVIKVLLRNPTTVNTMVIYGAQLEVGGPATPVRNTTTQPQGVYLWGIQAPTTAPAATPSGSVVGNAWQANHAYNIGDVITDSNGNQEVVTVAGTSGPTAPIWNPGLGGLTTDGAQGVTVVQSAQNNASATSVSTAFGSAVTATNAILLFVVARESTPNVPTVSDTRSNTYLHVGTSTSGPFSIFTFWCQSAAAGSTTVTASHAGVLRIWLGVAEIAVLASVDSSNTNNADSVHTGSGIFQTGVVTTANDFDMLLSFACVVAGNHATSTLVIPGFTTLLTASHIDLEQGYGYIGVSYLVPPTPTTINPQWNVSFAAGGSREMGITEAFVSGNSATLVWTNQGPVGLTTSLGYQYYYAFMNSITGHVSNVSPISTSTGPMAGQSVTISGAGMQITPSGPYGQDPQVDTIAIYRNAGGGEFWYQLTTFPNPGTTSDPGNWTYIDSTPDGQLTTSIFAPIGLLNSPPPTGMVNLAYNAGRMWGSVNNFLYYNTGPDNASLLSISQNGVPAESWALSNFIPFSADLVCSTSSAVGLVVFTTSDTQVVVGNNLTNFDPVNILPGHGISSYNAVAVDGAGILIFTTDGQVIGINPSAGSSEMGFAIGDRLQAFDPATVYIARHISGSTDNAFYIADGSTGWYRLNPNQVGASVGGEQTPIWSPKADFTASISGIGALASIEVTPGAHKLLVGQTTTGPVLVRDLSTFSDDGTPYQWYATIGSFLLAAPGKLAEAESISTQVDNSSASHISVAVLLDEISGTFSTLALHVPEPPQLVNSTSIQSNRFYLSQNATPPLCQTMQIKLSGEMISGLPASTKDEILQLTIRGAVVPEETV